MTISIRKLLAAAALGLGLSGPAMAQATNGGGPVQQLDAVGGGTLNLTSTSNVLVIPLANGTSVVGWSSSGITGSTANVVIKGTVDGTNYSGTLSFYQRGGPLTASATVDQVGVFINVAGFKAIEFTPLTGGTGSATITTLASVAPSNVVTLAAAANIVGSVNIAGNTSTATHITGTTSATAGVSSTIVAAAGVTKGIVIQNTCGTAEWFSSSVAAGTALTATNAMTLAQGASFITPDWYPISGAWTIASATAVACTFVADYK